MVAVLVIFFFEPYLAKGYALPVGMCWADVCRSARAATSSDRRLAGAAPFSLHRLARSAPPPPPPPPPRCFCVACSSADAGIRRGRGPAPAALDRNPLRPRPVLACRFAAPARASRGFGGSRRCAAVRSAASCRGFGLPAPIPGALSGEPHAHHPCRPARRTRARPPQHRRARSAPCHRACRTPRPSSRRLSRSGPTCSRCSPTPRLRTMPRSSAGPSSTSSTAPRQARPQIDRATDEIRCLIASDDGSEVHTTQLENEIARAQAAEAAMLALEALRETAARLYLNETGHSWRPAGGSRLNHGGPDLGRRRRPRLSASAGRDPAQAAMPEGTPVVFRRRPPVVPDRRPGEDASRRERLGHARQGPRACRRPGPGPWRRHQGRGPARRFLGRAAQGAAADLLAGPAARTARRVQAQRADALAQSALLGRVRRQRRSRAAGHPGEGEGHLRRRSPRAARHAPEACRPHRRRSGCLAAFAGPASAGPARFLASQVGGPRPLSDREERSRSAT